jgi:hypothetical protein
MKYVGILVLLIAAFAGGYFVRGMSMPATSTQTVAVEGLATPAATDPDMSACLANTGLTQTQCSCFQTQLTPEDFHTSVRILQVMARHDLSENARQGQMASIMNSSPSGLVFIGTFQAAQHACGVAP